MGKFLDFGKKIAAGVGSELKKLVNDNLTGSVECAHCKASVNVLSAKKTQDGTPICKSCYDKLPNYTKFRLDETPMAEIKELLEYVEYSEKELRPQFQPNFTFDFFQADTVHGLIKIENMLFKMQNLANYRFSFNPTEAKDGLFRSKVRGSVTAIINTDVPSMHLEEIMAVDVTAKAKKHWSNNTYEYEYPPKLQEYFDEFNRIVKQFKEANADTSC